MVNVVKLTDPALADALHLILHEAFLPYRDLYTPGAFAATVVSAQILATRISSEKYNVYGCYLNHELAGTISTKITDKGELYFMSMAVSPTYAGNGIGSALLKAIEDEAKEKQCMRILLETYAPLLDAIRLYEKSGYRKTSMIRDYSGIEIFEMEKLLG